MNSMLKTQSWLVRSSLGVVLAAVAVGTASIFVSLAGTPGVDGALTVTAANTVINQYDSVTALTTTTVTVSNVANLSSGAPVNGGALAAGDVLMLYQTNGATIDTTNTAAYGGVTAYGGAGKYQTVTVGSVAGNVITIASECGALTGFTAANTQAIRVPQLSSLTVNAGASIVAPAWNGTTGGFVAANVSGATTLNGAGAINVSGLGFRGAAPDTNTATTAADATVDAAFVKANNTLGAQKGESIAGLASTLTGGGEGRGAPANGGGAGNGHNAGGGGGSNAGAQTGYNGTGTKSVATANWADAWNLEAAAFATNVSPGGGRGGYTYSSSNQDALTVAPGATAWGGDRRDNVGGFGGHPLDVTGDRLFLGGGGGAGEFNGGGAASTVGGGNGGGLVYLTTGSVAGTGSILANGAIGGNSGSGSDSASGAGGGGAIVINGGATAPASITLTADGGKGGDQIGNLTVEAEGPGGGGGGGYIAANGGTKSAAGGANGVTTSTQLSEFTPNGATQGTAGTLTTPPPAGTATCYTPRIGVAKAAGAPVVAGANNEFYDIPYTVVIQSYGEDLTSVQVNDALSSLAPTGVTVVGYQAGPTVSGVTAGSSITTNTAANALSTGNLLTTSAGNTLVRQTNGTDGQATITFTLRVKPPSGATSATVYSNVANGNGTFTPPGGTNINTTDASDSGVNPDTDGDRVPNEAGENDPTTSALPVADLSVTKTINTANPGVGDTVIFTVTVSNSATSSNAGTVTLTDLLPAGYSFVGSNVGAAYVPATGIWTVAGGVNANASAAIQITATVNAAGPYGNTAQVSSSSLPDPDSTSNNSVAAEDDQATLTPGIRPTATNVTFSSMPSSAGPTTISSLAATDPDGTIFSYTVSTLPAAAQGVLYLADGITAVTAGQVLTPAQAAGLRFDPSGTFNGNATFTFTATDNTGLVDLTAATYTVVVTNTPPVATDVTNPSIPSTAAATTISSLAAADADGTIFSYTVSTLPPVAQGILYLADGITAVTAGQVLTPAQAAGLRFDPSGTFTGNSTFTFTATDNQGAVDATPATFTIPIGNNPPNALNVTNANLPINAGPTTLGTGLAATDTDGTIASYTVSTLPPAAQGTLYLADAITAVTAGQVLTPAQAAGLRFDPSGTFVGNVTFTYAATDNLGAVDATPATYTIPVVNNPPVATDVTNAATIPSAAGPTTISSLAATDTDGTVFSYTVSTLPPAAQGTLFLADGITAVTAGQVLTPAQAAGLRFDPSGTFTGNSTFTFTATDNNGAVDATPATFTIPVGNNPPVSNDVTTTPSLNANAGATTISSLSATDTDGTIASYTVSTLPPAAQGVLYLADGVTAVTAGQVLTPAQAAGLRFDPSGTFAGNVTFTFTATDNLGATDATPATYTIPVVNTPPVAVDTTSTPAIPSSAGASAISALSATDADGTIASYTVLTLPPAAQGILYLADGITVVTAGQVLTPAQAAGLRFDPSGMFNGNVTFTFTATDNTGAVDATSATYTIPVTNTPPIASDVTNATSIPASSGPTTISSLAATDLDGTVVSYTVSTLPPAVQGTLYLADGITAVTAGQVLTPAQAAGLRFDPSGTFNGNVTFTYSATDNQGAVDATPATFTIPLGNVPPVAQDITNPAISIAAGPTTISSFVATDSDGTIASYTVSTLPPAAHGTLFLADGITVVTAGQVLTPAQASSLRFDPSGTFVGNVVFTYTATDNNGSVDATPATFTIPVTNTPPVATDVTNAIIPSTAGPTTISSLAAADADGTVVSYTVSTLPSAAQGTLFLADGITAVTAGQVLTPAQAAGLRFDPSGAFTGNSTFTFTATDNNGAVDATPATLTIPVGNNPPTAVNTTTAAIPGNAGPTTISSLVATDTDGTIASYTVSTLPPAAQGILYLADGVTVVTAGQVLTPAQAAGLRFDPSGTFNGNATFTFTATDNLGASDATPATYTIPVSNTPPVATDVTNAAINDNAGPTTISSLAATDVDGTVVSYTVSTLPPVAQGVLYLADGITAVTAGQVLTPVQASSLRFDPSGTFTGNSTFTFTATDNNGAVDATPATFTIPVTSAIDLSVTKTSSPANPPVGSSVTFSVTVSNAANLSIATGVQVTDLLPSGYVFVSSTAGGAYNSGTGLWTVGTVNSGSSANIQLVATVLGSGTYANTAQVTAANQTDVDSTPNDGAGDDFATNTPTPAPRINLSMTKTATPTNPIVGSNVTFTLTVSNAANLNNATGVVVRDQLPTGYSYVSDNGTGAYVPATGVWTVGTVNSGSSRSLEIVATVRPTGVYTNSTEVTAVDQTDTNSTPNDGTGDDFATVTPGATPIADLSLTKTASSATPAVGSFVTFTVTVSNAGPSTATGVAVTDQLPSGYTFVSSTPSQGAYSNVSGVWTIGNINPGSSVTLQIVATVRATGVYGNTAQVTAATETDPDSIPNNNALLEDDQATSTPTPSPRIDLSALKTVSNAVPAVGSDVTFTVTLANALNLSTATGVTLTDQLPSGYTYVSHTVSQGSYVAASGLWTVGSVNSGSSVTLSIVATVRPSGIYANTAQVTAANETDINSTPNNNDGSENDQATNTPVPSPRIDLSLTKVSNPANPAVGGTVTFTLTVSNAGPSIATGVAITDSLPSGYSFVSSSPSQGAYSNASGIWSVGTVNASGTATLTINATVLAGGIYANTAQVTAAGETDLDSLPNNNAPAEDDQATDTPTPSPRADLRVNKAVTPASPAIGANATFTVTVSNNGPSTATGVVVTDQLPTGYTFVSATPSQGTYDSGTGIWTVGSINNASNAALQIIGTVRSSGNYTNTAEITASGVIDPTSTPNDGTGDDRDSVGITPAGFSTLSGRVYADVDLNGADNTEPGIGGVSLTLTGTDISGNPVSSNATTDGAGAFSFAGLPPSNGTGYTITQTQPASYSSGAITNGTPAGTPGVNTITNIVVPANTTGTGYAFGEQRADISVVKAASATTPAVGSNVTFTVTASNAGPTNASGVAITDALPSGYTYISDTGAGDYVPATGVWTIGDLAAAANATLTITARVGPSGNYANTAQLTASNQADPDSIPNNNNPAEDDQSTSSLTPVATIDLSVTKTSSPAAPAVGSNVTFLMTVANAANLSTASGVTITDLLPSGYNFVSATPSSGTYNAATGSWTLGTLGSGSSATLSVVAQVLATGPYANTAQVTAADQPDADSTPNNNAPLEDDQATDTPAPSPRADLSLSKTVSNSAPNIGSNVAFTVTLTNAGPSAATGVTVRDSLPSGFTFVSATASGATSYAAGTGIWTVPSIASASSETLTIIASVNASGNYTNVAEVTSSGVTDPDSTPNDTTGDDYATSGVTPAGLSSLSGRVYADVNLSGTDNTEPGIQGVTVTLTGTDANGLVVNLTTTTDATGAYSFAGLLPPQAATTYTLTQTQPANYSGTTSNVGTGAGGVSGSNQITGISFPSGTAATGYSFAEQRADLSVTKSASTTNPNVGTNVTFTVNVSNAGPTNATGVVVADALPTGFTLVGTPTTTAGTYAGGVWTVGALGSGATQTLTITASVSASGNYTNVAQLTASDQADPNSTPNNNNPAEDDQSAAPLTPTPVADIAVTKTGPGQVAGGATLSYTVTVVNNGPSSANNIVVTDTLPSALTGVTASGGGVVTSSTVSWTLPTLAINTPVSFTVTGTAPSAGTLVNLVSGSSSTLDTTPNNNDSNPANDPLGSPSSVTTQVVSAPSVTKSFSPNPIPAGGTSTLTVTLSNPNNTALTGASITDPLPSGLTPVAGTAATTCGGTATQTATALTLTGGTIPASGSCTLTLQVRPSSSASGKGVQVNTIPAGALTSNESPASPAPATATLEIASVGAAKSATVPVNNGDGTYSVTYTVTLENLGSVALSNLQAVENLSATFPSPATFAIQTAPIAGAGLGVNPAFNGSSNTNLLTAASSSLGVGASRTVVFTVRVTPGATPPATTFSNSVTASATGPGPTPVSDISNAGTDPDPNGNGNPSDPATENASTPVNFSENPVIGVAKQAGAPVSNGDGTYTVPFTVIVRNYGDVPLNNISAIENLTTTFGTTLVSSSLPTLATGSAGTVTPNAGFTGTGANTDLAGAGSSLAVNASATFDFSVVIRPTPAAAGFSNNVTAQGNSPAGTPVADNSTNGTDPNPTPGTPPTDDTAITPIVFGVITGQVFTDTNGDGAQQASEPNLTNTTVTITPTGGTSFTVTTDSAGVYSAVVPAGSTSADVTDPAATILTTANDPQTRVVTTGATATNTPVGFQAKAGLVGRVFTDANGNGMQDAGESGIAGLTVTVTPIGGGASVTATTNSSGGYTVTGLTAGQYSANVSDPAGVVLTTANDPQTVTVAPNGAGSPRPVGFQPTGAVVGRVFRDDNGNGSQGGAETGLVGVQVRISNGSFVSIVTTDANGDYILSGVPIGTATVDIVDSSLPAGVTQTAGTDPSVVTVLSGVGNSAGADGYRLPAPVATNNTATTPINTAVTFPVTADDSAAAPLTVVASSIDLDPSTPGEDKIRVVSEGKYTANDDGTVTFEPNAGATGSVTPIQYTVKDSSGNVSNAATLSITIGAATLGDVTGDVFNDANGNGVKDAGEGLSGVQVTVTGGASTQTVTTNASGTYTALGLPVGTATVDIVNGSLPAGLTQTVGTDPSTVTVVAGATANAGLDGYRAAPPVAVGDSANTPFNTAVTFPIAGNDTASSGSTVDPATVDLDPSTPAEDKIRTVPEGIFTVDNLGNVTFTPTTSFAGVVPSVNYTVKDASGQLSNAAPISVTVGTATTGVVRGIVYRDDNGNGVQDGSEPGLSGVSVVITPASGPSVTAITDSIGNYSVANIPLGNATADITDSSLPAGAFATVAGADPTTITVVLGSNDAGIDGYRLPRPVANDDNATTPVGTPVTFTITGNDTASNPYTVVPSSVDLDPATAGVQTARTVPEGVYAVNGVGEVTFTPTAGFSGNATPISYTVRGSVGQTSNEATIRVIVTPTAANDTATTDLNTPVTIPVLSNDAGSLLPASVVFPVAGQPSGSSVSPDGKTLTVPGVGIYTVNSSGTVIFTPANGFSGTAPSVLYSVSDGVTTRSASIAVTVTSQTVSGKVFTDTNGNGVQDAGEPGTSGATVTVTDSLGGTQVQTTDSNGNYTATVPVGSTTITVTTPSGTTLTTANNPQTVNVPSSSAIATPIGFQPRATIAGTIFTDTNGDGLQQAGEAGISGATVTITPVGGGAPVTVTTDANGNYSAPNLPLGDYTVSTGTPSNTALTTGNNPQTVTLPAGGAVSSPIGFKPVTSGGINGKVFNDANGNGIPESGEAGLSGAIVALYEVKPDGTPDLTKPLKDASGKPITAITDANGNYSFSGIPSGPVAILVTDPSGKVLTTANNPQVVTVPSGAPVTAAPVGYVQPKIDLTLTPDVTVVTPGDNLPYTAVITNNTPGTITPLGNPVFNVTLPKGVLYDPTKPVTVDGVVIPAGNISVKVDPTDPSRQILTIKLPSSLVNNVPQTVKFNTVVTPAVDANKPLVAVGQVTATAGVGVTAISVSSNAVAAAAVGVNLGVFSTDTIILGRVYFDRNDNNNFDAGDVPLPGARVYLSDGRYAVTDIDGRYNITGVKPGTYAVRLDPVTAPYAPKRVPDDGGAPGTRFVNANQGGGISHEDFPLETPLAVAVKSRSTVVQRGPVTLEKKITQGGAGYAVTYTITITKAVSNLAITDPLPAGAERGPVIGATLEGNVLRFTGITQPGTYTVTFALFSAAPPDQILTDPEILYAEIFTLIPSSPPQQSSSGSSPSSHGSVSTESRSTEYSLTESSDSQEVQR